MTTTWTTTPPSEAGWYPDREGSIYFFDGADWFFGNSRIPVPIKHGPRIPSAEELVAMEECVELVSMVDSFDDGNEITALVQPYQDPADWVERQSAALTKLAEIRGEVE